MAFRPTTLNQSNIPVDIQKKQPASNEESSSVVSVSQNINPNSVNTSKSESSTVTIDWIDNPLSSLENATYHIKFFLISEEDNIRLQGRKNLTEDLKNVKSIVIAESGSTGMNINELTLKAAVSVSYLNGSMVLTSGNMKIYEPMGLSFFDKLVSSAKFLGIRNFLRSPYYLQIKFHGYDETGNYIDEVGTVLSERRSWYYRIIITDIRTEITASGTVYDIDFVQYDDIATFDKYLKLESPFNPQGNNIREIIDRIILAKEQEEKDFYGYVRNKYSFSFVPFLQVMGDVNLSKLISKFNPLDWTISSNNLDKPTFSNSAVENNKKESNFTRGQSITNILEQIFVNTIEGQALTRRSNIPKQFSDDYEYIIVWQIVPFVDIRQDNPYDWVYNDYNYNINYVVTPYLTLRGIGTLKQQAPIISQDNKKLEEKLNIRSQSKRLKKRYDYIFTGLNTEILGLDLSLDNLWKAIIPIYGGNNIYSLNVISKIYNKDEIITLRNEIIENFNKIKEFENQIQKIRSELNSKNLSGSPFGSTSVDIQELNKKLEVLSTNVKILEEQNAEKRLILKNLSEQKRAEEKLLNTFPNNSYLEDFNIYNASNFLPVSIDKSLKSTNFSGRGNIESINPIEQSMASSILNQVKSGNLLEVKLEIKGDPYWLGVTHLERNSYVKSNNISINSEELIPVYSIGEYMFLLKFMIPLGINEDLSKPIINKNNLFTGLYIVIGIEHKFSSDGLFHQILTGIRDINIDISNLNI